MMKVYTRRGDSGTTSLVGGERVKKYDVRVEAYGTVDELTAFLGLLADKMRASSVAEIGDYVEQINGISSMLMNVGAHLAAGETKKYPLPEISDECIEELEQSIDTMLEVLPKISTFTIPGGCEMNSLAHVCRTVCRRAERRAIEASESCTYEPNVTKYLNRLSDYLYVLGRRLSQIANAEEVLWRSYTKSTR